VGIVSMEECGSLSDASDTSAATLAVRARTARRSLDVRRKRGRVQGREERAQQVGGWCLQATNQAHAVRPAVLVEIPWTSLRPYAISGCS
jgi:hypothetical protein